METTLRVTCQAGPTLGAPCGDDSVCVGVRSDARVGLSPVFERGVIEVPVAAAVARSAATLTSSVQLHGVLVFVQACAVWVKTRWCSVNGRDNVTV